jgi:hypothetical protein
VRSQSRLTIGFLAALIGWTVFEGDLGCDKWGKMRLKVVDVVAEVSAFCFSSF